MKCMLYFTTVLTLTITTQSTVQGQEDLEGKIERVFLYQPRTDVGETYNLKARIEELGPKEKVMTVLLAMISLHRNARPGTSEYLYLLGSTWVLGEMGERQAVSQLSRNLFDQDVDKDIRGFTARSLGQIDPEGSKSLLLKALAGRADYFMVRVCAADSLALTKDPGVLRALEQYSQEERDPYPRQRFDKAVQELKARIQRLR